MLIREPQLALNKWLCEQIGYIPTPELVCVGQWDNNKEQLIGVVGYDGWNDSMVEMHCAGVKDTYWLTKELLIAAFTFPFEGCNKKAIISRVSTGNPVAVKMNIGLGFKEQCRIRDGADDGDLIIFAMHRDECRWLDMKFRFKEAA